VRGVRPVSDNFLLNMAEVSAGLVGLFLVGMFFYVETGFRRSRRARVIAPYFRSSTRIVLVLYGITIGLSLTLVALEMVWSRVLFAALSLVLVASNVDTALRSRGASSVTSSNLLALNEVAGTIGVATLVVIPWALGGLHPSRGDLTWAILIAFATGFLSICTVVLSAFDLAESGDSEDAD
jgi:hypothetical protein